MKTIFTLAATLTLVLCLLGFADAHGGAHQVVYGIIQTIDATQIEMQTEERKTIAVKIGPSTRYEALGEEHGSWNDLREGMRIIVERDGAGKTAEEVRYAPRGHEEEEGDAHH